MDGIETGVWTEEEEHHLLCVMEAVAKARKYKNPLSDYERILVLFNGIPDSQCRSTVHIKRKMDDWRDKWSLFKKMVGCGLKIRDNMLFGTINDWESGFTVSIQFV